MRWLLPLFALLAACGGDDDKVSRSAPVSGWAMEASEGAKITAQGQGFVLDIPAGAHGNYITRATGSLEGKTRIRMTYRSEGELRPTSDASFPTIITLYFQRAGDNWSGVHDGTNDYRAYRWYAGFASHIPIGEGEIVAPLDGKWGGVQTVDSKAYPEGFRDALRNANRVGFVLGGGTGLGHGVSGPGRITITSFTIE